MTVPDDTPEPPKPRWQYLAIAAAVGTITGALVLGIGARIAMRVLALTHGQVASFSFGGTLEIVAYGALLGAASGLAVCLARPLLRGSTLVDGLVVGAASCLLTYLTLPAHIPPLFAGFDAAMIFAVFLPPFFLFGLALVSALRRLQPQ